MRENADQNNSEYGHFSSSENLTNAFKNLLYNKILWKWRPLILRENVKTTHYGIQSVRYLGPKICDNVLADFVKNTLVK